jgi:hypothetical protein
VGCLILGGVKAGEAADWVITPSIETKGEYLNNIYYSSQFRVSDYILSAGPKLDFQYSSEVTRLVGSLKFLGLHYLQNSNIDRINQYYNFEGSTLATSRLKLQLAASFKSTSSPTEYLAATGGVVSNNNLVTYISVTPGLTYHLTERWFTELTYSMLGMNYQDRVYQNYISHSVSDSLNYLLNERTTVIARITGYYAKYQNYGNSIAVLGQQLGFSRKFSEKWSMILLGGANFNQVNSNVGVASFENVAGFRTTRLKRQETTSVTPFVVVGTNYQWEKGGVNLRYERNQSANSYQNQSQYNNFTVNINQAITKRLNFELNPYFYLANITGGSSNYNSNYMGIKPAFNYKLTERTLLSAAYNFSYRRVTGSTDYAFPVHNVYLTLSYFNPFHFNY